MLLQQLLLVATATTSSSPVASFEQDSYCVRLCMRGLGGNLCQCNAVHFVGKRDRAVAIVPQNDGDGTPKMDDNDVVMAINDAPAQGADVDDVASPPYQVLFHVLNELAHHRSSRHRRELHPLRRFLHRDIDNDGNDYHKSKSVGDNWNGGGGGESKHRRLASHSAYSLYAWFGRRQPETELRRRSYVVDDKHSAKAGVVYVE